MIEVDLLFITCVYNRKSKTLAALKCIFDQKFPSNISKKVVILDDGSSDNTEASVKKIFPKVEVIKGDGNLFWAGGMRYLYNYVKERYLFKFLILFNDDIYLNEGAITSLINTSQNLYKEKINHHIVTGTFLDKEKKFVTYGGVKSRKSIFRKFKKSQVNRAIKKVDTLNMNLALVPVETIQKFGFLSKNFTHSFADYEYGLRVSALGGSVWVSPGVVGYCDRNEVLDLASFSSISELNKFVASPLGLPFRDRYYFLRDCGGLLWPIEYIFPYIKIYIKFIHKKIF